VRYVKGVALAAGMAARLVRSAVRQLVHAGVAGLVDVFQFSNEYAVSPRIAALAADGALLGACARYVTSRVVSEQHNCDAAPASEVLSLYCALRAGVSLASLCRQHSARLLRWRIDVRRLIAFGVTHGFVQRVFVFPQYVGAGADGEAAEASSRQPPVDAGSSLDPAVQAEVLQMCDGQHHTDEICCRFMISASQLNACMRHAEGTGGGSCFVVRKGVCG